MKSNYIIINQDGVKRTVTHAHFREISKAESHCYCISGKIHTLYPYNADETPFKIFSNNGNLRSFSEAIFTLALESGRLYHLSNAVGDTLFPYSNTETSYIIHTEDGMDEFLTKAVFKKLHNRKQHSYYTQGGLHVLLPLEDKHIANSLPTAENNEVQRRSRYNRCTTPSGAVCRGRCTKCPRNGEAIGYEGRENCCLKNVCRDDCNQCRRPREFKETLLFSTLIDSGKPNDDYDKEFTPADDSDFADEFVDRQFYEMFVAKLPAFLATLTDFEQKLMIALYGLNGGERMSARQFAEEKGTNHTKINRLHNKILERFKQRIKSLN